jgi:trans-aconitate methyltransferase
MDYLKIRRGYSSALYEKIISSTGTPVSLLDIGCGPGTVIIGLLPHLKEAVGIDSDERMIAEASKLSGENIRFSHMPLEKFSSDKQFDLITIAQAFEHMPESSYALINRHLRPGGTMAIFWKYADVTSIPSKLFAQALRPREHMAPKLKALDIETKLSAFQMGLETSAEFKSEEIFKLEDWILSLDINESDAGKVREISPKYVTDTFINYLWLFRKA